MFSSFAKPLSVALLAGGMALAGAAPAAAYHHGYGHYHHYYHGGYGYRHGYYHHYYRSYGYRPYIGVPCIPVLGVVSGNYCNY